MIRTDASEQTRRGTGVVTPILGPARALAVAKRLRARIQTMVQAWSRRALGHLEPVDVGLVSGMVDGLVAYGAVASPATPQLDAIGEPVIKAFRFAQLRDSSLHHEMADRILVCTITRNEVERLLASEPDDSSSVLAAVRGVTFAPLTVDTELRGVINPTCHQAAW